MTKIPNFRLKIKYEDNLIVDKKADKFEELDSIMYDLRRKFK